MLSLAARLEMLEEDLRARPLKIYISAELPFALFRYDPDQEWELRRQLRLLASRLESPSRQVVQVSLAELLWEAIAQSEGLEAIVDLERDAGFKAAQEQVTTYLTGEQWHPLVRSLTERLNRLDADRQVAFVVRAACLAPALYPLSKLLNGMVNKVRVPGVLFFPGTCTDKASLQYMGLAEREAMGSYRAKTYV